MKRPPKILLIVKKTSLALVEEGKTRRDASMRRLVAKRHPATRSLVLSHDEHTDSARSVRRELRARGLEFVERARAPSRPLHGFDLVITVGGDGTLLEASHAITGKTVVLGVNSAPAFSVGFLTGCRSPTFARTLDMVLAGELQPIPVERLRVSIGRRALPVPVLNDVLFCHDNPAVTTRFRLQWHEGEETQRSSGVWISAPAGSTAALRSAGGTPLPLTSSQFAFVVREPYAPPGSAVRFEKGVLDRDQKLVLESLVNDASIFLDGSHRRYPVRFGDALTFGLSAPPLRLVRPENLVSPRA